MLTKDKKKKRKKKDVKDRAILRDPEYSEEDCDGRKSRVVIK